MSEYRLRDTLIEAPYEEAFEYIAEPANLPEWTHAFERTSPGKAVLRTPNGGLDIDLEVRASRHQGTIDWIMTFPDGFRAMACSRLTRLGADKTHYGFVLTPPPVPLEELEGALDEQAAILEQELDNLSRLLSNGQSRQAC